MCSGESPDTESEPISATEGSSRPQAATSGPITRPRRSPLKRSFVAIAVSLILLPMSALSLFQWITQSDDGRDFFNENRGQHALTQRDRNPSKIQSHISKLEPKRSVQLQLY